jgi:hypothetical protein
VKYFQYYWNYRLNDFFVHPPRGKKRQITMRGTCKHIYIVGFTSVTIGRISVDFGLKEPALKFNEAN